MNIKGLRLTLKAQGDDVKWLQDLLGRSRISIRREEAAKQYFGTAIEKAVSELQEKKGLEPSGIFDEDTAKAIQAEIAALSKKHKPRNRWGQTH